MKARKEKKEKPTVWNCFDVRQRDLAVLQRVKRIEEEMRASGRLHKVEVMNGYALTTRPEEYT